MGSQAIVLCPQHIYIPVSSLLRVAAFILDLVCLNIYRKQVRVHNGGLKHPTKHVESDMNLGICSTSEMMTYRHTHAYVQHFIPNTVAAFGLLLNKEPGGTAAGRTFSDVPHLLRRTEILLLFFGQLTWFYFEIIYVQYRPKYLWLCTSGVWICAR